MRWIMVTQQLDPDNDRLGFMLQWVEELAARLDHLDVICQQHAQPSLPENVTVHSMGKESGAGRLAQAGRFTQHLRRLIPKADGIFCHMIPRYVLFAAPWARLYHKPLLLWYTHRQISPELRLARLLATHILTASPGSFPLPTSKVHIMGHGVDTRLYPDPEGEHTPPTIVQVARLSSIKRQDKLIRAASQLAQQLPAGAFEVKIIGGPVEKEPDYPAGLDALIQRLEPVPPVVRTGPLPYAEAVAQVRQSAITVNLSPPGLFDKAALEGMLAGKPTLVTNQDFVPLLGDATNLLYMPYDADDATLAERLDRLLALTPEQRAAIGADLRRRTLEQHSLESLMDHIIAVMDKAVTHD